MPNTRKGGWYKLDLLVIGGYFVKGSRGSGMDRPALTHFLCAVAVPPKEEGDKPEVFHSFCKVGSGYTKKELQQFNLNSSIKCVGRRNWKINSRRIESLRQCSRV